MLTELNSNLLYLVPVMLLAGLAVVLYVVKTRRNAAGGVRGKVSDDTAATEEEAASAEGEVVLPVGSGHVNALVMDTTQRSFGRRTVILQPGKNYGRQWRYGTDLVYWLYVAKEGLKPVVPPEDLTHPPSELYEALQTKADVETVFGPRAKPADKVRIGLLVAAACVALFLMYLSAST